jgi:hypothetical protein
VNTDSHGTRIRVLPRFICAAALGLATVLAHAAGNGTNVPKLELPSTDAHPNTSPHDPALTTSATGISPPRAADAAGLAEAIIKRYIAELSPEEREAFMQSVPQPPAPSDNNSKVTIKVDNPNCFLEDAGWSSCFNDLPPEPEWNMEAASDLYSPRFWQLRSLWTKTPIEHLE